MCHARRDILKLLLYAALVIACGAWLAPLFYNAGHALAEVTGNKITNGFLHWLGGKFSDAELPAFYRAALVFSALLLFLPWLDFLSAGKRSSASPSAGPWFLKIPSSRNLDRGQPLMRRQRVLWETFASFLLAAGFLLPALLLFSDQKMEVFPREIVLRLPLALAGALAAEFFFRGLAFGIFIRAGSPWFAIAASALFFTLAVAILPPSGVPSPDPELPWTGFRLLKTIVVSALSPGYLATSLLPVFLLGLLLSHARWRTASLAVPVGIQTALLLVWLLHGAGRPFPALFPWFVLLIAGGIAVSFSPGTDHGDEARA